MDTSTCALELIHFHLIFTSSVLEMSLLFAAASLPLHHHVVAVTLLECTVEEVLSQV